MLCFQMIAQVARAMEHMSWEGEDLGSIPEGCKLSLWCTQKKE